MKAATVQAAMMKATNEKVQIWDSLGSKNINTNSHHGTLDVVLSKMFVLDLYWRRTTPAYKLSLVMEGRLIIGLLRGPPL